MNTFHQSCDSADSPSSHTAGGLHVIHITKGAIVIALPEATTTKPKRAKRAKQAPRRAPRAPQRGRAGLYLRFTKLLLQLTPAEVAAGICQLFDRFPEIHAAVQNAMKETSK